MLDRIIHKIRQWQGKGIGWGVCPRCGRHGPIAPFFHKRLGFSINLCHACRTDVWWQYKVEAYNDRI